MACGRSTTATSRRSLHGGGRAGGRSARRRRQRARLASGSVGVRRRGSGCWSPCSCRCASAAGRAPSKALTPATTGRGPRGIPPGCSPCTEHLPEGRSRTGRARSPRRLAPVTQESTNGLRERVRRLRAAGVDASRGQQDVHLGRDRSHVTRVDATRTASVGLGRRAPSSSSAPVRSSADRTASAGGNFVADVGGRGGRRSRHPAVQVALNAPTRARRVRPSTRASDVSAAVPAGPTSTVVPPVDRRCWATCADPTIPGVPASPRRRPRRCARRRPGTAPSTR